jgi:hypothetical protein
MQLELQREVSSKVGEAIFITGCPRTGTSLMSNLIYSLDRVECFSEPPFLNCFLRLLPNVEEQQAKFILESFLFHELFYQGLAGRRLNFNEHDESCVYRSRPRREIADRMARSLRFRDLFPRTLAHRLAFKVPGVMAELGLLRTYYNDMTFLVMLRRPDRVIASLMGRGWCSDQQLFQPAGELVFHRRSVADRRVPSWVPLESLDDFVRLPELDRCAVYYLEQYRHLVGRTDCIVVDYDALIKQPKPYFSRVVEALGESFGALTQGLLESIREPGGDGGIALDRIEPERRRQVAELYAACRALAFPAPG